MSDSSPYADERELAERAVWMALRLIHPHQGPEERKTEFPMSKMSSVASQALIVGAIRQKYSKDPIVAEDCTRWLHEGSEFAKAVLKTHFPEPSFAGKTKRLFGCGPIYSEQILERVRSTRGGTKSAGRFWVINGLDGLSPYEQGGQWTISICLIVDGKEVVVGMACANVDSKCTPRAEGDADEAAQDHERQAVMGTLLSAEKGCGAHFRELKSLDEDLPVQERLWSISSRVTARSKLQMMALSHPSRGELAMLGLLAQRLDTAEHIKYFQSSQMRYIAVIFGAGDFFVQLPTQSLPKIWQHAGPNLLMHEIGGKVTDMADQNLNFGNGRLLAKNPGVVAARATIYGPLIKTVFDTISERVRGHPNFAPRDESISKNGGGPRKPRNLVLDLRPRDEQNDVLPELPTFITENPYMQEWYNRAFVLAYHKYKELYTLVYRKRHDANEADPDGLGTNRQVDHTPHYKPPEPKEVILTPRQRARAEDKARRADRKKAGKWSAEDERIYWAARRADRFRSNTREITWADLTFSDEEFKIRPEESESEHETSEEESDDEPENPNETEEEKEAREKRKAAKEKVKEAKEWEKELEKRIKKKEKEIIEAAEFKAARKKRVQERALNEELMRTIHSNFDNETPEERRKRETRTRKIEKKWQAVIRGEVAAKNDPKPILNEKKRAKLRRKEERRLERRRNERLPLQEAYREELLEKSHSAGDAETHMEQQMNEVDLVDKDYRTGLM